MITRKRRGQTLIDVVFATLLMAWSVLAFAALYPSASRSSRASAEYAQACTAVQHKIDQMRAVGYGRLTYTDLRNAGIIDTTSNVSPFRFEIIDDLDTSFWNPLGTITVASAGTDLRRVVVRLDWKATPGRTQVSTHQVSVLIANE
jgi:Tfp pilus assembly protein PilV